MLAETAKLAIELNLTGNAKQGIAGVQRSLAGLSRQSGQIGQGFKTMGAGIGVAFRNLALLAVPVIGGLAAGLIKSVKEGQEAAKVQTIYANAIQNSGKVSTQYVDILNKQQTALMNLAGIDDELIKSSQTRLIQMGLTGEQVAKVTPLVLDFAKATGLDLETATKLTGKSINGNIGALSRYGVQVDKAKAKVDPFAATVDALNSKFAGTTKALSGSLEVRLGALREGLANVREEAGMKLLPALTRIVDIAGKKLVPAFAQFMDRILPSIISGIEKFADILENGGAERAIKGITGALGPMVQLLKIAAAPVKAIVDAFLKLPSNVQGALIAGVAINKLSGGLIAQGGGQVVKGGLSAVGSLLGPSIGAALGPIFGKLGLSRGATPANPLFVSDVAGGLGGKVGATGGLGAFSKVFLVGEAIGLALLVNEVRNGIADASTKQSEGLKTTLSEFIAQNPDPKALQNALDAVEGEIIELKKSNLPLFLVQGDALKNLQDMRETLRTQLAEARGARLTGPFGHNGPIPTALNTVGTRLTALQVQLHADLQSAIGVLKTSNDPAAVAAAVARAVADIRGGAGSAGTTGGVLTNLKAQLAAAEASNNPELATKIKEAIKQIEPFQKGRQWQAEQIAEAKKVASSNKSTAEKVAALKGIQQDLLSHQRTMAADIVAGLLGVVNAVHNIKLPAGSSPIVNTQTGFVTGGKPLPKSGPTPKVNNQTGFVINAKVTSSIKDTANAMIVRARWGKTATQAGAA